MRISNEELQRRLNSTKNLTNILSNRQPNAKVLPMYKHTPPAPPEIKKTAAILVGLGASVDSVKKELHLSDKQVRSATEQFADAVASAQDRVRNLALDKLMIALGLMTQDKFENASLKDLSTSAAALAKVADKMQPRETQGDRVQFIVHVPQAKSLGQYKVVDV